MGLVTPGVPERLVAAITEHFPAQVFVELGTFKGDTALWAARNFRSAVTVEASEALYEQALKRLAPVENVRVVFGDSRGVLPTLCQELNEPAIFWLDSHWSGGQTSGAEDECPLLEELRIILPTQFEHVVLIDDARYFVCPPSYPLTPEKWPTLPEILGVLREFRPNYDLSVIDDVIVLAPPPLRAAIQKYCQKHCMVMEWRLGTYLMFLHRPSLKNLIRLVRVMGGVVLKRWGWLRELPDRVIREAPNRFGYSDD